LLLLLFVFWLAAFSERTKMCIIVFDRKFNVSYRIV